MQTGDKVDEKLDETLILEVLAGGGKVCLAACFIFQYFLFLCTDKLFLCNGHLLLKLKRVLPKHMLTHLKSFNLYNVMFLSLP